jgi:hypothetical protein
MTIRLEGSEAIRVAEVCGLPLHMYAVSEELTPSEARQVDPRWIYLDVDLTALVQQVAAAPTEEIAVARAEALVAVLADTPANVLVDALASTPLDAVDEVLDAWIAGDDLAR